MFASLSRALESDEDLALTSVRARAEQGDSTAMDVAAFTARVGDFPFRDALAAVVGAQFTAIEAGRSDADLRPALAGLLAPEGLGLAGLPKGLVPFHRRGARSITPVEEHLDEALLLARDRDDVTRVHFTIPEGAEEGFWLAAGNPEEARGRIELQFSTQSPATDTVALAADGRPFRTPEGALLFRPGGHGALLRNLEQMAGDLVLVKNVDNVQPEDRRASSILWQRLLVGFLVRLQREVFALLDRLDDDQDRSATGDARAFLARWLEAGEGEESDRDALRRKLDRPLRVAGMVLNAGEPGGGPFWTRDREGRVSKQIVEAAEIARTEPQQRILRASTHFNPVLLALALRDRRGHPYRLADFVDSSRVFVSERTSGGATLRALEHPGLWNGSMAGWNTVFVEIPKEAFTPVKTVLDLLRPEHQPAP